MKTKVLGLMAVGLLAASAGANAALVFAGQWQVDQGPAWGNQPLAYTGQEAAALLFGGLPTDYVISTVDADPANSNNMAWYSILGVAGGHEFAEDYVAANSTQAPGYYYSGNPFFGSIDDAASAYVSDNASGPRYTNYAFRIEDVPEPASLALLGLGLAGLGLNRRRKA